MSDKCGNCDCADKSQCVKKGNAHGINIVETQKSHIETVVMEAPAAKNNGKCNCNPCTCTDCRCGQ
ncbi:hypothetical protein NMG60_11003425 [Bertholletia excelsa]